MVLGIWQPIYRFLIHCVLCLYFVDCSDVYRPYLEPRALCLVFDAGIRLDCMQSFRERIK